MELPTLRKKILDLYAALYGTVNELGRILENNYVPPKEETITLLGECSRKLGETMEELRSSNDPGIPGNSSEDKFNPDDRFLRLIREHSCDDVGDITPLECFSLITQQQKF